MSTSLSTHFIRASVLYAILGMALGIHMAASHDHAQMPTHAHLMLLGWVGMAIYAFVYKSWPETSTGRLPSIHRILAHLTLISLTVGLFMIYNGEVEIGEPIASIASLGALANMVLFAIIVWRGTR